MPSLCLIPDKVRVYECREFQIPCGARRLGHIMVSGAAFKCWDILFCCRPVHPVTFGFPKRWTEETPSAPAISPEIHSENIRSIRPAEHVSMTFWLNALHSNRIWQIPFPKDNTSSANQEILRILWKLEVHYHVHNSHRTPVYIVTFVSVTAISILSCNLLLDLGLQRGLFPSHLPTKTVSLFFFFHSCIVHLDDFKVSYLPTDAQ